MSIRLLLVLFLSIAASRAMGSDWPRFRGPDGTGVSPETGLLREWPTGGPTVAWSVELNPGYSGASVRDGAVYVMDRKPGTGESIVCLDLRDGKERWRHSYKIIELLSGFDGSRHAPAVDTNLVFTVGPLGHLTALDRFTGAPAWTRHLIADFSLPTTPIELRHTRPGWGFAQCPILYRDTIIVAPYATHAGVVALDKATGLTCWQSGDIGVNTFSFVTPELATLGGVDQVLTIGIRDAYRNPPGILSSVDAANGAVLWQTATRKRYNVPIPQPLQIGTNLVFYTGGYRIGAFVLDARQTGSIWEVRQVLSNDSNCTSHIQSPVLYREHIYAQSFDAFHNTTNNGMVCLNLDMTLRWRSVEHGLLFDAGPFLVADGMIFVLHGQTGELFLLDADPDRFRILARAKVLEAYGGKAWAPMALSNGRLLARDQTTLKCIVVAPPTTLGTQSTGDGK
jgi:outer membrane protein assembly factor BamB